MASTFEVKCLAEGVFSLASSCANIDDCVGHSCGPHGNCVDGLQSYTCRCEQGFEENTLPNGERVCGNVDDCQQHGCGEHGICLDLVSDYTCECEIGYILTNVSRPNDPTV